MIRFEYLQPTTLEEVSLLLSRQKGKSKIIAGGTEILVRIKDRELIVDHLVSLSRISGLRTIQSQGNNVYIGAMTTLADLENSKLVKRSYPVLFDGVEKLGSVQIRNVATLGGNLCNAAPCADTAPPLLVLDADVSYWRSGKVKRGSLEEFFVGPGETVLQRQDILLGIHLGVPNSRSSGAYLKFSRRGGMDIALLGMAVQIQLDKSLSICEDVAIALGVAAPTPIRMRKAEGVLKGERISDSLLLYAAELASQDASPRDSYRCSSEYRQAMIKALLPGVLKTALSRIRKASNKGVSD